MSTLRLGVVGETATKQISASTCDWVSSQSMSYGLFVLVDEPLPQSAPYLRKNEVTGRSYVLVGDACDEQ